MPHGIDLVDGCVFLNLRDLPQRNIWFDSDFSADFFMFFEGMFTVVVAAMWHCGSSTLTCGKKPCATPQRTQTQAKLTLP